MKLLILSFSRLESDPRIRRQIDLFRDDWDVVTVGYGPRPEGSSKHFEVPEEFRIWRYPRLAMILRQYRWTYAHNRAIDWVRKNVPAGGFDAAIANDVDAAGIVGELAPRNGFHADLHEFAPLQNSEMLRFRLFVAPFVRWQLRRYVRTAASTSTVGRAIADRYRREFGLDPIVVMNAPAFSELPVGDVSQPMRIVHAGAALRNRRLEVLIDAVVRTTADVTLDLYLPPNDPAYLEELRQRAAGHARVQFREPVPFDRLVQTLNGYDVGIHILASTNYNNTYAMPNKFFEYVQARLGLIIGPSPEMRRALEEYGIGAVSDDFDADSVVRVLDALTPEQVAGWKAASERAAHDLSAQAQTPGWSRAVAALRGRRA